MKDISEDMKEKAAKYFSEIELGADEQTRISLFLMGIKSMNALILSKIEFQSMDWLPYSLLHNQYHKEIELTTLLYKATQWTLNPFIFSEATQLNLSLWRKAQITKYLMGFFSVDQRFFEYVSLSHAFMSEPRFIPLLPFDTPLTDRFISALHAVEVENGRQIQTQIRLLKDMEIELSQKEKEQIVEKQRDIVSGHFNDFLATICRK